MNGNDSGAAPGESRPSPLPYRDRYAGLLIFGALTALLGCCAGLFVLLMFVQSVAGPAKDQISLGMLLPAMFVYAGLAVALVWLGIGSMMARRWARALLLIFSWSWLAVGVFTLVFMAFLMPRIMAGAQKAAGANPLPPGALAVTIFITLVMLGVLFVLLPLAWLFFYSRPNVRATCDARDPHRNWTDACPLPALAVALWLATGVPMLVLMAVSGHPVLPVFGGFLSGIAGAAGCLAFAGIWAYAAWSVYKLKPYAWWLVVTLLVVVTFSSLLTFARHNLMEMYRLLGYPQAQLEQLQQVSLPNTPTLVALSLVCLAAILGYLVYARRYFHAAGPSHG